MKGHRTDVNQSKIVSNLIAIGATVTDLSAVGGGCPDLLVGYRGVNYLFEIKRPKLKGQTGGKLNELQIKFHALWRGKAYVITTFKEAFEILTKKNNEH